jgi:4-hydroxy-tetrahydrodipicolinate synthase
MLEARVPIIAVCGGTGEFPFLAEGEKRRIAEIAGRHIGGRAKLIVQTSAIRTEDAIENSRHAEGAGADALLILPPYFEGPGESGVRWHYEQIARAVKLPIMVYNIPQYSGFDITPTVLTHDCGRLIRSATSKTARPTCCGSNSWPPRAQPSSMAATISIFMR